MPIGASTAGETALSADAAQRRRSIDSSHRRFGHGYAHKREVSSLPSGAAFVSGIVSAVFVALFGKRCAARLMLALNTRLGTKARIQRLYIIGVRKSITPPRVFAGVAPGSGAGFESALPSCGRYDQAHRVTPGTGVYFPSGILPTCEENSKTYKPKPPPEPSLSRRRLASRGENRTGRSRLNSNH